MSRGKYDDIAVALLTVVFATAFSYLMVAALTWGIAACAGFDWSWGLAGAVWAAIILLRMVFGGRK